VELGLLLLLGFGTGGTLLLLLSVLFCCFLAPFSVSSKLLVLLSCQVPTGFVFEKG
jgi:hypothetical protein